jgi:hypothetical protein
MQKFAITQTRAGHGCRNSANAFKKTVVAA